MTATEYKERSERLFDAWQQELVSGERLTRDGAVNPARYYSDGPRILFVLKEVNGMPNKDRDLPSFLAEGGRGQTWNNVVRWTIALKASVSEPAPGCPGRLSVNARKEVLPTIAVMNLKKVAGGARAVQAEIHEHADRFKAKLNEQFGLLDPHIVVACGVPLDWIVASEPIKQPKCNWQRATVGESSPLFIWTWHPQARKRAIEMYDRIVRIRREACVLGAASR